MGYFELALTELVVSGTSVQYFQDELLQRYSQSCMPYGFTAS